MIQLIMATNISVRERQQSPFLGRWLLTKAIFSLYQREPSPVYQEQCHLKFAIEGHHNFTTEGHLVFTTNGHHKFAAKRPHYGLPKHMAVASPLAAPVLQRQDVPLAKRAEILRTLALSKATYGVAIWGPQDNAETANWAAGITKLYRLLFPEDRHTEHPTLPAPADVWAASGQPSPAALMRLERLSHVVILAKGLHETLWTQLEIERDATTASWWHLAEQDVEWLT